VVGRKTRKELQYGKPLCCKPSLEDLFKIAEILDVEVATLFTERNAQNNKLNN